MKKITVNLKRNSYPIYINPGLIKNLQDYLSDYNHGQKWIIISQHNLMELFGYQIEKNLNNSGFDCQHITLPKGEAAKSLNEYSRAISQMIEFQCDRKSFIISLGGGVIGDVAGFISSTFMRGIEYVQVPTTLLAMVDSSIGGKTGINIPEGKNLIGSIYQPKAVFIDQNILNTLPQEEVIAGLGEIIKYGAISDVKFFEDVSVWLSDIDNFPFEKAIENCCNIKASVVSEDEHEHGLRKILNFGHTIAHALESNYGFQRIKHGEAVSLGMLCAGYISLKLNKLDKNEYDKLKSTIRKLPLPELKGLNRDQIMNFIKRDKKYEKGILNFIILNEIGSAQATKNVPAELLLESLLEI
jgi:3-dehydroquinate synthase|tara:strand:+ start:2963 stop:4030 length:1068 start_codon:yes stop_codon:yes gene_type:complete